MSDLQQITYTVKDAARVTGFCRSSICNAISNGSLPSLRVVGRRLIKRTELEAWLERGGRPVSEVAG